MQTKTFFALAAALAVVSAGAASADVVQTTVGIQQGSQQQYLEGRGFQSGASIQNLGQYQYARPSYRGQSIQQTAAGVQTVDQLQQGLGRVNQRMMDMRNLQQEQFASPYRR
jgi:opacity protein-like surface antigen